VLVPIILFTSTVLKDASLAGGSRANLERVLAAARRAKDVVKKILMFTRELDEAKLGLIDLRVVVTEGLNLFSALAPPSIEKTCSRQSRKSSASAMPEGRRRA